MSEFTCKNGHLMRSRDQVCSICGSSVYRMDGFTDAERQAKNHKEPDEKITLPDGQKHEPGCPAIADGEDDQVLHDFQECCCKYKDFNSFILEAKLNKIKMEKGPTDCPCKGTGLIPCPDGEAICRAHWPPKKLRYN